MPWPRALHRPRASRRASRSTSPSSPSMILVDVQLQPPPLAREEALGSQQHHQDERDAVQEELVLDERHLREVHVDRPEVEGRDADRLDDAVDLLEDDRLDVVDDERADRDAPDVAHAAEDDHRQDRERHREQELVRRHDRELRGIEDAGQAGRRRPEGEREELRRDRVDAVGGRRQLVLADRVPGPPDPRILQPVHEDHRDRDDARP